MFHVLYHVTHNYNLTCKQLVCHLFFIDLYYSNLIIVILSFSSFQCRRISYMIQAYTMVVYIVPTLVQCCFLIIYNIEPMSNNRFALLSSPGSIICIQLWIPVFTYAYLQCNQPCHFISQLFIIVFILIKNTDEILICKLAYDGRCTYSVQYM